MSESKNAAATRRAYAQRKAEEKKTQEKAQTKAKEISAATGKTTLTPGTLSPLELMQRDAQVGITTQDKIDLAKGSGLAKGSQAAAEVSKKKTEEKTKEQEKARATQTLSSYDKLNLSSGSQQLIQAAKLKYDQAKAAGDAAGMKAAHEDAEKIRRQAGYSGGAAGDAYISPELTAREKATLNDAGERKLKAAKMEYSEARAKGDSAGMQKAQAEMNSILQAKGYKPTAALTSGHGMSIGAGGQGDGVAALKAAGTGIVGSLLSVHETANQALRNYQHDRWRPNDEQTRRTVDPSLPGQQLMKQSQEYAQQATEGMTGLNRFLANTAISGGQMLPAVAASFIPVVGPAVGAGLLGAQAAGSKAYAASQQGDEAGRAFSRGLTSGLIEGATERIGLGNLVRTVNRAGGASYLKNIAEQMGIEATEESAAYALNHAADVAYQDPEAQWSWRELAESAASGAILGGVFGGAGTALGQTRLGQNVAAPNSLIDRTVAKGLDAAENTLLRATGRVSPAQQAQSGAQDALLRASGFYDRQAERAAESVQAAQNAQATQEAQAEQVLQAQAEALQQANQELQARLEASRQQLEQIRGAEENRMQSSDRLTESPQDTVTASGIYDNTVAQTSPEVNDQNLPEGQGAMSRGGAGDFATWQSETPGSQFHPINEQAAAVTAEERGRAPVEVPTVNLEGRLTSKTVSTLMNSNIMPNEMVEAVEADLAAGAYSRLAYSDSQALEKANRVITDNGYQNAKEQFLKEAGSGKFNKDISTLGIALINHAANSPSLHVDAMDLLSVFQASVRDGAQGLQAVSMINKLTPQGQLYMLVKTAENIEAQANERASSFQKSRKNYKPVDIDIDQGLIDEFLSAQTQQERDKIKKQIYKGIASQLPNTFRDRFDAWRYIAMLGNLRTNIKNIGGNLGFVPVRAAKNFTGTVIESALRPEERTKAFYNPVSAEGRAKLVAAAKDFREVQDIVMAGGKYRDDFDAIARERDVFADQNKVVNALLKPLSLASKATTGALETGDLLFTAPAYITSLTSYLSANKITANEYAAMDADAPEKVKAREYATKEAQKATYRDVNMFSDAISNISRTRHSKNPFVRNVVNPLVEGTLPFKRTPANIAVRGVEYSPVGLGIGTVDAARNAWWNAKEKRAEKLGQELTEAQREVKESLKTPAEAIDEISAGLTGTGLLALGIFLAYQGVVTGGSSGDEKQDEFNELQGHQNYSMEVGDTSYTLDWLAPEALPFFVGVETYNNFVRLGAGDATIWDVISSVKNLAEPMLEMSMLQSLNDLFDTLGSDDPLIAAAAQTATSYLTQAFPTLASQVERSGEENRESTFVDRNSNIPPGVQRLLANLGNKIPGWEYNQADYVDAWGRKDSSGDVMDRILENMVKPWYQSDIKSSDTERELQRLYDAGYEGVFPGTFQKNAEINGEYVTADQYTTMQTTRGQTAKRILDSFISTDLYADMSDDEKAKFIEKVYDYAANMGKVAGGADSDETFSRWQEAAQNAKEAVGLSEAEIIAASAYQSVLGENAGDEVKASIKQGMYEQWVSGRTDITDEQKTYLKNNIKFYQMISADASSYNKAVAAGYSDPQEIQALHDNRAKYDMDADGNTSSNAEILNYISSATEDPDEREKMWNALKEKGEDRTYTQLEKDFRATVTSIQNAKASLDNAVSAEKQTAFASAISNAGAKSQADTKKALLSVDATDAERAAYYNLVKAKQGWKKTYYQVKMK